MLLRHIPMLLSYPFLEAVWTHWAFWCSVIRKKNPHHWGYNTIYTVFIRDKNQRKKMKEISQRNSNSCLKTQILLLGNFIQVTTKLRSHVRERMTVLWQRTDFVISLTSQISSVDLAEPKHVSLRKSFHFRDL